METMPWTEVEPGLKVSLPVERLTHSEHCCIIAHYLQSPLSTDLSKLLYFEFYRAQVDIRRPELLRGQVVVAEPDGSAPEKLEILEVPSPSSDAQAQWRGTTHRIAHILCGGK